MSLIVTQNNNNLTLQVSQENIKATLSVTQTTNSYNITAVQNNEIVKLQPVINDGGYVESDPIFTTSEAYLFEDGDKDKLDSIEEGAEVNIQADWNQINPLDDSYIKNKPTIPTVLTNHSELTLDDGSNPHNTTKTDLGLSNVDNTSDLDKPISTATQNALDLKLNTSGYSDITLPLQDTDELLVNRGGTWYKVDKSELGGGDVNSGIIYYKMVTLPVVGEVLGAGASEHAFSVQVCPQGVIQVGDTIHLTIRFECDTDSTALMTFEGFFLNASSVTKVGQRIMTAPINRKYATLQRKWLKITGEQEMDMFNQGASLQSDDPGNGINAVTQVHSTVSSVNFLTDDLWLNCFVNCPVTRYWEFKDVEIIIKRNS